MAAHYPEDVPEQYFYEVQEGAAEAQASAAPLQYDVLGLLPNGLTLRELENEKEQESYRCDFIVLNVAENANENLYHIVIGIARQVGVLITEQDIQLVRRCGPIDESEFWDASEMISPRSILVTMREYRRYDEIMSSVRSNYVLISTTVGWPRPPQVVYIMERLTEDNRELYNKASKMCIYKGWRDAWVTAGKIYVRRAPNTPTFLIRTQRELHHLFGDSFF